MFTSLQPNAAKQSQALLERLFNDKGIHHKIVSAVGSGIAAADSVPLAYAPRIYQNLQRHFNIFNDLARVFVEFGFSHHCGGIHQFMGAICPQTKRSVQVNLMSFFSYDADTKVFTVRRKGPFAEENIALNSNELTSGSLFPMQELIEKTIIRFESCEKQTHQTVFLFYSFSGYMESQQVSLYIGFPKSIDKSKTMIECERVSPLGSFSIHTFPSPDTETLPVEHDFEPRIEPIVDLNESL
jgi:hypothetical protein